MYRNLVTGNVKRDVSTGSVHRDLDLCALRTLHHTYHGILRSLCSCNDPLAHLDDPVTLHETGLL